jgi:hypothetical protein
MKNNHIKSGLAIATVLGSLLSFSTVTQADILSDTDGVIGSTWVAATSPFIGYNSNGYNTGYNYGYGTRASYYAPDYGYGYRTVGTVDTVDYVPGTGYVNYRYQPTGYLSTCDRGCAKARHTHLMRDANGHWTKKTHKACETMRGWY